eukprot:gene1281-1410_t
MAAASSSDTEAKDHEILLGIVNEVLCKHFESIKQITEQQRIALRAIFCEKRDVFAILPTGHGNSLIYQVAPLVADRMKNFDHSLNGRNIVIVISSLLWR